MATQEGNSLIGGMTETPPVERDMDMAETGEASGEVGKRSGKTTRMSFDAASEQWERKKNGNRLRNKTLEPVSTPGDWRSWMERTVRPQAGEVTQVPQTIARMARMLEAHVAREQAQCLGMKALQEDRETKWDGRHKDNVLWGMGIVDMIVEVLAKARPREAAPSHGVRREERDKTAKQDGGGLETSQYAGATQDGEPEKCQLQRQPKPKPKPKQQLTLQPEPRHEPEPKPAPTPIPARRWETVQP